MLAALLGPSHTQTVEECQPHEEAVSHRPCVCTPVGGGWTGWGDSDAREVVAIVTRW